ncbi:MAG: hypothetical protein L6416_04715 [Candidatus Omnitrophica bacterium]|nr:hypothetical protein [Candidatus Omnitrophota bacterium]
MKRNRELLNKKGFTLFEILISSMIIVTAIIGVVGTLGNLIVLSEINRGKTLAVIHGQYVMETIKDAGFTNLETDINNGDYDYTTGELSSNPFNFEVLLNEAVDTQVISGGNPLRISVTVTWQDRTSNTRTLTFETLKSG